jgi:hypothetical protein
LTWRTSRNVSNPPRREGRSFRRASQRGKWTNPLVSVAAVAGALELRGGLAEGVTHQSPAANRLVGYAPITHPAILFLFEFQTANLSASSPGLPPALGPGDPVFQTCPSSSETSLGCWMPHAQGTTAEGTRGRIPAARSARVVQAVAPEKRQRAQGKPGAPNAPAASRANEGSTRASHYRSAETPAFPAQRFTTYCALSSVSMTSESPSHADHLRHA